METPFVLTNISKRSLYPMASKLIPLITSLLNAKNPDMGSDCLIPNPFFAIIVPILLMIFRFNDHP